VIRSLCKARFEQRQQLLCVVVVGLFNIPTDSARKSRAARMRRGKD
jgi:hypothetical protein